MKKFTFKPVISLATVAIAMSMSTPLMANWEQVRSLPNTYAHFITSEGVQLMSDYRRDREGGIYYSEDNGINWTKSEVRDYCYSNFYEADGYVFALGSGCRIGRSEDGGRTWDLLNYSKAVEDWLPKAALDETVCYGLVVLDGVLYAGDFSGGGVICSNDYGETWEMTDRESLYIHFSGDSEDYMDNFYHLEAYKGKVYAFGLYSVHAYVPEEKKWLTLPINSNCLACVTIMDETMICGRAMTNFDMEADYLLAYDGENWNALPRPDTDDNNVRALGNDGKYLYSIHNGGPMYYTDNMGETWYVTDTFEELLFPLTFAHDADYIYTAVYSPIDTDEKSGLWRFPKSELKTSGVKTVEVDAPYAPHYVGSRIICGGEAKKVSVMLPDGKEVLAVANVSEADLSPLPAGIYLYSVDFGNRSYSGKIIKQ